MYEIFTPIQYDKNKAIGFTLSNGINVIMISDENIKKASCCIGVQTGSRNDKIMGTAHLLEHLLFMGTEKYPDKFEFTNYVAMHDGTMNAMTTPFSTLYYANISKANIEKTIDMLTHFFIKPIITDENIKSEIEIIEAEHSKNKSNIGWIIEILGELFIKNEYYNKFSTGSIETLKNITKQDLYAYYDKYYAGICACVITSSNIEYMEKNYLKYFESIPKKKHEEKKEKILLKDENCIYFTIQNSYKFLSMLFITHYEETQTYYQLLKIIQFLIVSKYEHSLYDILKDCIYDVNVSNETYDEKVIIKINYSLKFNHCLKTIIETTIYFFNYLSSLTFEEVKKIYDDYENILNIERDTYDEHDEIDIVANSFIDKYTCIEKAYIFETYNNRVYEIYKKIINYQTFKIISNSEHLNNNVKTKQHEYYNVQYSMFHYDVVLKKNKIHFNVFQSMLDVKINTLSNEKHDMLEMPVMRKNTFILDKNKYGKNISYLSIIRINKNLLCFEMVIMFEIYTSIYNKMLLYYIELYSNYNCMVSFDLYYDSYCIEIMGINSLFIEYANKMLNYDIFTHEHVAKYFEETIKHITLNYENYKYKTPIDLCEFQFHNSLYNTTYEKICEFIHSLTFEDIKKNYIHYYGCNSEKRVFIGNANIDTLNIKTLRNEPVINVKINELYVKNKSPNNEEEKNISVQYYILFNTLQNNKDNFTEKVKTDILTTMFKMILDKLSFNYLRTVKKLGYIVGCFKNKIVMNDNVLYYIYYTVQSCKEKNVIVKNIKNFNDMVIEKIKKNKFKDNFVNIKKGLSKKYLKLPNDIHDEIIFYKNNLYLKNESFDFNVKNKILEEIDYETFKKNFLRLFDCKNFIICNV